MAAGTISVVVDSVIVLVGYIEAFPLKVRFESFVIGETSLNFYVLDAVI